MKPSFSLNSVLAPITRAIRRFHLVITILIIAGSLAVAIFMLNSLIMRSQEEGVPSGSTTFDTETINRIEELHTRKDHEGNFTLPKGRINPFVE